MKKAKVAILVALVAIGLAGSSFAIKKARTWLEADQWRKQLARAPENRVAIVIQQIAELDEAGIPVLVEALGSDRGCVVWAAKQKLLDQLNLWRSLSVKQYDSRLLILLESLSQKIDRFSFAAQFEAADLATRILAWPVEGSKIDQMKLLAASEKVLRAGMDSGDDSIRQKMAGSFDPAGLKTDDLVDSNQIPVSPLNESDGTSVKKSAYLTDAGLFNETDSSLSVTGQDELEATALKANQPGKLDWPETLQPAASSQKSQASRIPDYVESAPAALQSAKQGNQAGSSDGVSPTSLVGSNATDGQSSPPITARDAMQLMAEIRDADKSKASAAESELIRRGFTAMQLDLARRLSDPDPAVRKQLVQLLPSLQNVDAVPWLLRLCHDADADVRLEAITFLATSSDPSVLNEVEQISQLDTDSRIRRLADRVAQQRNARR
jgi:hypothetical protein